jgi:hypothetical protein
VNDRCCEHDNDPSSSINGRDFPYCLSIYYLLKRRHCAMVFVVYHNNLTKTLIIDPITKSNQNVISSLVARQADEQMQFCCYVFILPTLCKMDVLKWGGHI